MTSSSDYAGLKAGQKALSPEYTAALANAKPVDTGALIGESRLVSPISAWRLPVAASAAMRFRARRSSSVLSAALSLGVTERAMSAP
jgi:hypothetical protein